MKKTNWIIGDANTTTLVDKDSEEQSKRESQRGHLLSGSYREGDFYYQDEDPESKNCAIM